MTERTRGVGQSPRPGLKPCVVEQTRKCTQPGEQVRLLGHLSGTSRLLNQRGHLLPHPLEVFLVLQC